MTQTTANSERLSRLEGAYEHLATKADVERVRADLSRDIGQVRSEVERVRTDLSRDIEQVRSELRGMKWVIGVGIAAAGALGPILTWALS